jgi:Ca2+-binding EF-hand superfamily protein
MVRPDYNPGHFFHYIDCNKERVLNFHNMKRFFLQQGLVPFEEELIEILRRFDKDDDGTISLTEFTQFIELC